MSADGPAMETQRELQRGGRQTPRHRRPEEARADLKTIQPEFTLKASGDHVLVGWNWGAFGASLDMCELQVDRNDGKGRRLLAMDSTPGYNDTAPWPATPTKWTYWAIYRVATPSRPMEQPGQHRRRWVARGSFRRSAFSRQRKADAQAPAFILHAASKGFSPPSRAGSTHVWPSAIAISLSASEVTTSTSV